jgi:hypothetical protein
MRRLPVSPPRPFHAPGILLSINLTTFALSAHAQSGEGASTSAATTLWEQALDAMSKQDYARACPKIEEVARLRPDGLGAKLKLAECYEGAGRLASAWALYALIEPLAEKANQPDRQKTAHDRVEALTPKLARLTIVVPDTMRAQPGLEIRCDTRVVEPAQWGLPLPVDRGRHVIVVTATAMARVEQPEVIEADGATRTVTIVQPASVTPPPAVTPPVSSKRSVAPAVVLGLLAAGGIGTGIGFTAAASSKDAQAAAVAADLTAHYGTCVTQWASYNTKVCADIKQKLDARNTFEDVALGAFIGGGVAAASTVLYLLWPAPKDTTPKQAVARDLRLTPIVSPTGGTLFISGAF